MLARIELGGITDVIDAMARTVVAAALLCALTIGTTDCSVAPVQPDLIGELIRMLPPDPQLDHI